MADSRESATWNNGCRDVERTGLRTSTRRSNGTSACANADRSVSRTRASSCSNDSAGSTSVRSTNVLTNIPTRSSSAGSPRPATGAPMAMSVVPLNRASNSAYADCITMNSDELFARARSARATCSRAGISMRSLLPALDDTAGRGLLDGNAS
ncbi:hypothetical protein QM588_17350 [Rhodococcus sp. IEGM 1354]|nr:hypothetical protein [Rhodococcus sp. IEGM 1354]MDI9932182.1 hypothetical protein [Rhodococcus sp. IEGM 1354]